MDRLLKLNKSVILIGEVPFTPSFREAGTGCPPFSPLNDPRRSDARYSQCFPLPTTVAWQLTRPFGFHRILQEIAAKRARVTYWDPFELMCPSGDCLPYMDGHRLYFDNSHLTYQGSRAIGRAIVAAFGVPLPILIALAS